MVGASICARQRFIRYSDAQRGAGSEHATGYRPLLLAIPADFPSVYVLDESIAVATIGTMSRNGQDD